MKTGPGQDAPPPNEADLDSDRRRVRDLMWELAGIVRSDKRLRRAEKELEELRAGHEDRWRRAHWTAPSAELRNLLENAALIVRCARLRRESRGLHYTEDHPWRDNERFLRDTIVRIR